MPSKTKTEPMLVVAGRSHWLEPGRSSSDGAFGREEFHPILELEVSRVGRVFAQFSVDRYRGSDGGWGNPVDPEGWRVVLRDVRAPAPEGATFEAEKSNRLGLGPIAAGVGDATRATIRAACEPVIRGWIGSDDYLESRRSAAAAAIVRTFDGLNEYRLKDACRLLELARSTDEIDVERGVRIRDAFELAGRLLEALEAVKES